MLNLVDSYVGGFPLIIVGIGELISINWVYGFGRFNEDIRMMLGRPAPIYFMIMWCGFSPLLMIVSTITASSARHAVAKKQQNNPYSPNSQRLATSFVTGRG